MAVAAERLEPRVIDQVEGVLTYLVDTGVRPVSYNYEPPPGVPQRSGIYAEHKMPVVNGRRWPEAAFSLDRQGFLFRVTRRRWWISTTRPRSKGPTLPRSRRF
jgi:hypothetical protein